MRYGFRCGIRRAMKQPPRSLAAFQVWPWIGEPWVLAQPGSLARSLDDEVFRKCGFEPPSATVLTVSLHLYMRLIETGRWLGFVPASVMRFGGKQMQPQGSAGQSVIASRAGRVHYSQGSHANSVGGAFY